MACTGFCAFPHDLLRLVLSHVLALPEEWPGLACAPKVPESLEHFDGLFRLSHGPVNRQLHIRRWRAVSLVSTQWRQLAMGFVRSAMVRIRLPTTEQKFLSGNWVQSALGQLALFYNLQCLTLVLSLDDTWSNPPAPEGPEFWFPYWHQHTRRAENCWTSYADLWRSPTKYLLRDGVDCSSALSPSLIYAGLLSSVETTSYPADYLSLVDCVRLVACPLRRLVSLEVLWPDTRMAEQLTPIGSAAIQALLRGFGIPGTLRALRLDLVGLQPLVAAQQPLGCPLKYIAPHLLSLQLRLCGKLPVSSTAAVRGVIAQLSSLRALEISVPDFQGDDDEVLLESGGAARVFKLRRSAAVLAAALGARAGDSLRHVSCWLPDHTPVPYAALLHVLQPGRLGGPTLQTLRLQLVNSRNFPSHEAVRDLAQLLLLHASSLRHLHLQAVLVDLQSPTVLFPGSTTAVPCPELIQALARCTALRTLRFQECPRAGGFLSSEDVPSGIGDALVQMPELRCFAEVNYIIANRASQEFQPLALACPRLQHISTCRLGDDSQRIALGLPAAMHDLTIGTVEHEAFLRMLQSPWRRRHLIHLQLFSQRLRLLEALQEVAKLPCLRSFLLEPSHSLEELTSALPHLTRSSSLRAVVVRLRVKEQWPGTAAALDKLESDSAFRITTMCLAEM